MIIKAKDVSGKSSGWLKKVTPENVDLKKTNGYSLTGSFYRYDEAVVINEGEFFVIDTGRRGTRTLYDYKGLRVEKEIRREEQKKAGLSESVMAAVENSLLYDFGAYVVALEKNKGPQPVINPLEKYSAEQLVKELQDRGHKIKIDDEIKLPTSKSSELGRFAVLEMK